MTELNENHRYRCLHCKASDSGAELNEGVCQWCGNTTVRDCGPHEVEQSELNRDEIKAELIRMRKYVRHHQFGIGECVAWNKLKRMFGVGYLDQEDWDWLSAYEKKHGVTG